GRSMMPRPCNLPPGRAASVLGGGQLIRPLRSGRSPRPALSLRLLRGVDMPDPACRTPSARRPPPRSPHFGLIAPPGHLPARNPPVSRCLRPPTKPRRNPHKLRKSSQRRLSIPPAGRWPLRFAYRPQLSINPGSKWRAAYTDRGAGCLEGNKASLRSGSRLLVACVLGRDILREGPLRGVRPARLSMQHRPPYRVDDPQRYLDPVTLAKVRSLELQARLIVEGYLSGMHKSPYHGFSVEFAQHREYVPGDDLKHLDWKVYSRTGRFYLKQYEVETNIALLLLVDTHESI